MTSRERGGWPVAAIKDLQISDCYLCFFNEPLSTIQLTMLRRLLALGASLPFALASVINTGTTCYVYPEADIYKPPVDDTPWILQAFELCAINGTIVFPGKTYPMNQVVNTTGLVNRDVEFYGELIWSQNNPYR